jgi:hypothetical protein
VQDLFCCVRDVEEAGDAEVIMAALLYRQYLIIATGQYDNVKDIWLSIIDLSWGSGPYRGSHVINDSSRSFQTKEEAETFGVEIGKAWIDEHLRAA